MPLSGLSHGNDIESSGDRAFGGVRESKLYKDTVTQAYLHTSSSGARAVSLTLESECGSTLRQDIYFTSGTAKGGNNYYVDRNGNKRYLPGYESMNDLAIILTGKTFPEQTTDIRTVPVYNREAEAVLDTNVQMLVDWIGKEVITGVIKQVVSVNKKDASGEYVPTAETREENEIDKFFFPESHPTNPLKTVVEAVGNADANYIHSWSKRNTDKTRDRVSKDAPKAGAGIGGGAARSGRPAAPAAAPVGANLFND